MPARKPTPVMRRVREVTRGIPRFEWILSLSCGHEMRVSKSIRPKESEVACERCRLEAEKRGADA